MSDTEIEISLGRIADIVTNKIDQDEKTHHYIKGSLLKKYLNLRASGETSQKISERSKYQAAMKKFFIEQGKLQHKIAIDQYKLDLQQRRKEQISKLEEYRRELTLWKKAQSKLPILKRFFHPTPNKPKKPIMHIAETPRDIDIFISESMSTSNMPDFLISTLCSLHLNYVSEFSDHINNMDINKIIRNCKAK